MNKSRIDYPVCIYLYGLPGAGKTFIARQLAESLGLAHVSSDRLRFELFENPRYDKAEYQVITHLMDFMTEQFLNNGISVVYDISVSRLADRRTLRALTRKFNAKDMLVWVQTDIDTAWQRCHSRDRRKTDDRYSNPIDRPTFDKLVGIMQNPQDENYLVISGKHLFDTQKAILIRRLKEIGAISNDLVNDSLTKPELINLVSRAQVQAGRVDYSRRNITIR